MNAVTTRGLFWIDPNLSEEEAEADYQRRYEKYFGTIESNGRFHNRAIVLNTTNGSIINRPLAEIEDAIITKQ